MSKFETLSLRHNLSDEELLAIRKEMSEHINKKKNTEDELKTISSQMKAEISGHDAIINKNSLLITAGYIFKPVKCEIVVDHTQDTVFWIREDTADIAQQEKPIPARFLQEELNFEEGEGA
jgi:hypothetical protein